MKKTQKAFTLLEILLVVAAISILAGIVVIAINPTKQLGDARNAQRRADVATILNAVYQYAIDNNGTFPGPGTIPTAPAAAVEICSTGGTCNAPNVNLSQLTTNEKYLVSLPKDPKDGTVDTTKYTIVKSANGRITVAAPSAEGSPAPTISASR